MSIRGENALVASPKEQVATNLSGKKDSYRTHLWRTLFFNSYQRGKPISGKLSGARTENSQLMGILCPFLGLKKSLTLKQEG